MLNKDRLDENIRQEYPAFECVEGDGCNLTYPDASFEVGFSNSVIEHVGTFERQEAFAKEI